MKRIKKIPPFFLKLSILSIIIFISAIFSNIDPANFLGKGAHSTPKEQQTSISYKLPPGFSEQVVFESDIDGDVELYLLSQAGIRKLTNNDFPDGYPVFSPDGKKILYHAQPENHWQLFITTLKTGKIERVFSKEADFYNPCWAPDGKTIVFDTELWGKPEIGMFDIERGEITRLTDTIGENLLPDFSPDGRAIAFTGKRIIRWQVFTLDIFSKKIKSLTGRGNCRPHWSPEGNWIAYVQTKKKHDICLMKPDGSESHSLTKDPDSHEYYPNWSRDGKRIYFAKSKRIKGPWNIWVINSDGTQPFQITFGNNQNKYPDVY